MIAGEEEEEPTIWTQVSADGKGSFCWFGIIFVDGASELAWPSKNWLDEK